MDRTQRTYWTPPVEPIEPELDLEPVKVAVRISSGRRPRGRERLSRDVVRPTENVETVETAVAAVTPEVADDGAVEHVGRRRRVRPEVALTALAIIFVAGALLKPWPNYGHSAATSALATPEDSSTLVPLSPADVQVGISGDVVHGWDAVDWSIVGHRDTHPGWGVAAVVMPSLTGGSIAPDKASPQTTWIPAGPLPVDSTLKIPVGLAVYAIAVTWPSSLKVSKVTFQFVGGPDYPVPVRPPGFPNFVKVSPVPAEAIASPVGSAATGSSASSSADSSVSLHRIGTGAELQSGRFWIPPLDAALSAAIGGPATPDWHVFPWPWPNGSYLVGITSSRGTETLSLQIERS